MKVVMEMRDYKEGKPDAFTGEFLRLDIAFLVEDVLRERERWGN